MSPAASGLRHRLRGLSPDERRAFLAALYRARGFAVETVSGGIVATAPPERVVVAVPGTGDPPAEPDLTLVLGNGDRPQDGRPLDAAALDGMLRHAVDRETAADLCRRHLDRPLDALDGEGRRLGVGVPAWLTAERVGTLVALVVVAAGVALLLGPANPATTLGPDPLTPAAAGVSPPDPGTVATATTTAPSDGFRGSTLAPGLGSNGLRDADALARSHADWLSGRSYTWTMNYSEYQNGERVAALNETVAVEGPTVYRTAPTRAGAASAPTPVVSRATYADGRHRYVWTGGLQRSAFSRTLVRSGSGDGRQAARAAAQLRGFLDVEASAVVGSTGVGGDVRFFLSGGGTDRPGVENYTVAALVDRNGVVRQLTVDYRLPAEDRRVVYTFRYEAVGETTVDAPGWYDRALNATTGGRRFP